jgi:hypothetical protein
MRMRTLLVVLLPALVFARKPKADSRLTYVDDEPMATSATQSHRADPTALQGARMDATMRAPEVGHVAVTGEMAASVPTAELPASHTDANVSGGAVDELVLRQVERQMRKNQPSIDACAAAAVHRRPTGSGTVELAVVVADKKVKSVHVASDTVHDVDFDACLVKAGLGWKLQVASAQFKWPVTLSPSASR